MEKEPRCSVCDAPYSPKRAALGIPTCLDCGQTNALKISDARRESTVPAFNKGAYSFITPGTDLKTVARKI